MAKMSFAQKLRSLFGGKRIDGEFFDDLADALVEGDIGAKMACEIAQELERACRGQGVREEADVRRGLRRMLLSCVRPLPLAPERGKVSVYLLLGVNGVGKTTTAAKIARFFKDAGENVILAACDTFRAAAEEQLGTHGKNVGVRVIAHQHGTDPSSVVFDAGEAARAAGGALVVADTAGRLHNKENLVRELQKIDRVASSKADAGCYKKILVIDSTTGQNAVRQAEVFSRSVGVDAVVLTKCDSTAKGGAAFCIGRELGIPVCFVCTGERYGDIAPFDGESYVDSFLGT